MSERKAWLYRAGPADEWEATIVYARTRTRAEMAVVQQLGFFPRERNTVAVERKPEFDGYGSMAAIPYRVYFDLGWTVTCGGCGTRVASDGDEYQEPCFDARYVYCTPKCMREQHDEWAYVAGYKRGLRFALAEWLPGCRLTGLCSREECDRARVHRIELPKAFGHTGSVFVTFEPETIRAPVYYAARVDAYMASIGDPTRLSEPGDKTAAVAAKEVTQ